MTYINPCLECHIVGRASCSKREQHKAQDAKDREAWEARMAQLRLWVAPSTKPHS